MSNNYLLDICHRLFVAIEKSGMSYGEIAEKTGIPKSAVHRYATGLTTKIPLDRLQAIARVVGTPAEEIMGWNASQRTVMTVAEAFPSAPRLGQRYVVPVFNGTQIANRSGIARDIIDEVEVSEKFARAGDHFGLKVADDSMEPRMLQGDTVIIRKNVTINDGDFVAVTVGFENAAVKRYYKNENGISLNSLSPKYKPLTFTAEQIDQLPVQILGKVVELRAERIL